MEKVILYHKHNHVAQYLPDISDNQVLLDLLKSVAELARAAVEQYPMTFGGIQHEYAGVEMSVKDISDNGAVKLFSLSYYVDHTTRHLAAQIMQVTFKGKSAYIMFYRSTKLFDLFVLQCGTDEEKALLNDSDWKTQNMEHVLSDDNMFIDTNSGIMIRLHYVGDGALLSHTLTQQHQFQAEVLSMFKELTNDSTTQQAFDKDYVDFVSSLSKSIAVFAFQENDYMLSRNLLIDIQRVLQHHTEVLGLHKVNNDFSNTEHLLKKLQEACGSA